MNSSKSAVSRPLPCLVFALAKERGGDESCQQNLDNLAASNMSNVGLIYPIGIIVFLLAS